MAKGIVRGQHDHMLFVAVCVLSAIGLVMVYSASYAYASLEDANPEGNLRRQAAAVAIGLVLLLALSHVPTETLRRVASPVFVIAVVLLVLALATPKGPEETRRFISVGAGLTFQPSTLATVGLVLMLAAAGHQYGQGLITQGQLSAVGFAATGLAAVMILLAPNLSTALLTGLTGLVVLLVAGVPWRHLAVAVAALVVGGATVALATDYMDRRIKEFLRVLSGEEPGYQVTHALFALGSGGPLGKGLCQGVEKFGYLPEVHNDMIFAAIGEELGLVMTLLIVSVYCFVMVRGFRAALGAPTLFGRYLAAGLTTLIAAQAAVNMLVVTATVPVTGLPLPFISAGGTSVAILLGAVGLILSVSREYTEQPGEVAHGSADTTRNGRNGRTRIPSSSRGRFATRSR